MPFTPRLPAALTLCALVAAQSVLPALADEGSAAPPAPEVTVEVARSASLPLNLEYSARAAGYREVEVRAQVSGILQKRTYEEGRPVKQGQVLFQIDPRPYQAALGQAKGALAQAQARYRQTDRDLKRIRELQRKGFASASELDRYTSDYEQAKADVEAAKANVDAKQIDLDYTTVKAPISGMASKETRSEGSLVTASDPNTSLLTELTQLDPIYVNFAYSDTEAARLREGVQQGRLVLPEHGKLNAQIFFGDGSRYPIDGVVDFTDSFVNTGTGTNTDQRRLRLRLIDFDVFLQAVDQIFLEIAGRNGGLGDFAQRHDRVFIVVAVDGNLRSGRNHARAMARQKNEIETIFNLVDAVFDRDSGHRLVTP